MRTRNFYFPNNSSVTIPRRRNKKRTQNVVEPDLRTIIEVAPMAYNRTMDELLQAPTEGDVPNDVIKLMMFPYSLEGSVRVWIDKLADQISTLVDIFAKKVVTPAPVKVVEESCVTCGGAHAYYNCPNTDSNQPSVCVATGTYNQVAPQNLASNYMAPPGFAPVQNIQNRFNQNQGQGNKFNRGNNFHGNQPFQVPNQGFQNQPFQVPNNQNQSSTSGTLPSNTIPNPKGETKAITTRSGVAYEGPSIPTPKKNGCMPRLGRSRREHKSYASFHWKKLSLPELTPTRMTLELADRSITRPKGVAKDVFIKVGNFHFLTDFIVVDIEADPRVPLILGRSFLRIGRPLIDVYGEEITLSVNDEAVNFNLNQTMRYSSTYDYFLVNRIDIIDVAREEYAQEILGFSNNYSSDNPTSTYEPILSESSPSLTPFEGSDFILEDIEAYLKDESISSKIDHADCDMERDICLIEEFPWVSHIHCVPKKGGITVVENENNELIPIRLVTGWRVCIDYRKLNDATCKDHFPLPFMDQIMPFGLCNAPGTFQRRMMAIFDDMIEKTMEVFMDDFLVFRDSFSSCLSYLDTMIQRCEDTNLVLNWEKCHFIIKEGIVLGHKISNNGLEFNRAKVDVIAKLPHPMTVKGVRSFLGHASYYRRFIQDFSTITRPMTYLLEKETPFVLSKDCIDAFENLKKKLTEASILVVPD
uniref:Reverse transcriptase domain-containing protein n=1 Tax=Tanacetum cinerariifolium TaxID=118510 RepID=A0A6L2LL67_TANCI|nr:reverse transcriptase domain-containing protein [Tanacetum cinerariifolium]